MKYKTRFILQKTDTLQIIGVFKSIHSMNDYIKKNYPPQFNINSICWTEVLIEI